MHSTLPLQELRLYSAVGQPGLVTLQYIMNLIAPLRFEAMLAESNSNPDPNPKPPEPEPEPNPEPRTRTRTPALTLTRR